MGKRPSLSEVSYLTSSVSPFTVVSALLAFVNILVRSFDHPRKVMPRMIVIVSWVV